MNTTVRVFLADDHTLVRSGIRRILESHAWICVIGEAGNGREAISCLAQTPADVLVLDLKMEGLDGIEVLRAVKKAHPALKVVILTMHADREYVIRAMEEGANGYLLKDSAVQDLIAAIEAVTAGRAYFSPVIQQHMAERLRDEGQVSHEVRLLTERERDVLRLLSRGGSTKEIATALDISTRTVDTHRANLMRKLGLRSVALLTQFAIREGIVDFPTTR